MNKKSRRQKKFDQNRQDIIDAALKIFQLKGYKQSTISEIAKEADFSVGTIYNFFESKKELFDAIIDSHVMLMVDSFEKNFSLNVNPIKKLLLQLDSVFETFEDKVAILKFWYDATGSPISSFHATLSPQILEFKKMGAQKISETFSEAIKLGLVENIDPKYLALSLDGIIYSFISAYIEHPEKYPLDELLENFKKIFFQSIVTSKGSLILQDYNNKEHN